MSIKSSKYLNTFLQNMFPQWQGIRIRDAEDLTAGWESAIYALNLSYQQEGREKQQELILRIYEGDHAGEKAQHEFTGMQLLHEAGYPVPQVYTIERQPTQVGNAFMVMERIHGDVMWSLIDASSPHRRSELLAMFCDLILNLHQLDWEPFVETPSEIVQGEPLIFINRWIEEARRTVTAYDRGEFIPILDWLAQHKDSIETKKPSVVHNDFHPANVLVSPDGSAVVIDWTGWQVTDYRFDLAWTMLLTRAYAGEAMYRSILAGYETAAGKAVDNIEFFEVCACARRLFDVMISLSLGAEQLGMRAEAVESMRSQIGHLVIVYNLLREYTRLKIPQVEYILLQHEMEP